MSIEECSCWLADIFEDGYAINIQVVDDDTDKVEIAVDQGNGLKVYQAVPKYIAKRALAEAIEMLGE